MGDFDDHRKRFDERLRMISYCRWKAENYRNMDWDLRARNVQRARKRRLMRIIARAHRRYPVRRVLATGTPRLQA